MQAITPHGFTNLGGKQKPDDPRDLKLGAATPTTYTFPKTLTNSVAWSVPVEYQAQQPACGAHSGAKEADLFRLGVVRSTPRFTWHDVKTFDGFAIDDGTDMRSVFKSITKTGTLDFALLGNDVAIDETTYARSGVTPSMYSTASKRNGGGYGFIKDVSFNGIKQFLSDHGPSIVLIEVGSEFWTALNGQASWLEKDILPLRTPSKVVSGHFVVLHSYDEQYIYFLNSWSDQWGRKGHGYFAESYLPFVLDVGAIFPLEYDHDLYYGITDPDVKRLQAQLNQNTATQVAPIGQTGGPGTESTYFGPLTFAAVKKYQALNNIPVTGYVGPLTRAALTKL